MPVDLRPAGEGLSEARSNALIKNEAFEAIRMIVPQGYEVCHNHQVDGPITVQCLTGCVNFNADGDAHELRAGHWVFLPGKVPHTITGVEDSLILLTVMFR
jgi:quercetin dioxygenase-like cupin family protein